MIAHKCMICGKYDNPDAPGFYDTQWVCDECIEGLRLLMGRCPECGAKGIRDYPIDTYYGPMYYCGKCGQQTPREEEQNG